MVENGKMTELRFLMDHIIIQPFYLPISFSLISFLNLLAGVQTVLPNPENNQFRQKKTCLREK